MKSVTYSSDAIRTLKRMPRPLSKRVQDKVRQYAAEPATLANNVKALKGRPGYARLRVGDWRVIMIEAAETVRVDLIAPRGSAYE